MIKNITREIEPKIDKGIKLILLVSVINLIFANLINTFTTQWIINVLFCSLVLYELFILNKNLDFICLLDVKKEDIYNNLMLNYFKISIILLILTYFFSLIFFRDYILGLSLIFPIFIFISSFLLEYIITRKISSIIKYIAVAILYLILFDTINPLFWISISYLFIKMNSFVISEKKDYKFIKNNLFLNSSILLYASLFIFLYPYNNYYYLGDGSIMVSNVFYNYSSTYLSFIFFLISIFIVFITYYYFKNKYNLKAKNKFIDFFFLSLTYLVLLIGLFTSPFFSLSSSGNLVFIIQTKIFISIFILILIFVSSKIKIKPKKLGEMYDKYL